MNVISAQDLAPVSRSMRTYAVAWVHPDRKLSTRVDTHGHNNPTWNDKFVFRVDEEFLHADTSAVMIEIYALHWFRDVHVGTIRVLVGNLIPTPPRTFRNPYPQLGMRFVALQVRRPSGRPQGILNIGVALLHSAMRSMPLYSQLSTSAVGYKQLMGEEEPHHHNHNRNSNTSTAANHNHHFSLGNPGLRRTMSDSSSLLGTELRAQGFMEKGQKGKSSSMVNGSEVSNNKNRKKGRSKASSVVSGSEIVKRGGKASSVINGSEILNTPKKGKIGRSSSLLSGSEILKGKTGRSSSVLSFSEIMVDTPKKKGKPSSIVNGVEVTAEITKNGKNGKPNPIINAVEAEVPKKKAAGDKIRASPKVMPSPVAKAMQSPKVMPSPRMNLDQARRGTPLHGKSPLQGKSPFHKLHFPSPYEYGTPRKSVRGQLYLTESELGPSPSEVAAEIANNRAANDDAESSIIGAWSVDESVEGLQSKLERWRTELPPVYDRGETSTFPSESRHARRNTDGGGGLFSCFSNICGCQCSIVCGAPKKGSTRIRRSPSADKISYL
ncbi:hypothetical protein FEM48_Zijuj07G0091000 [Ziziphus jujuba var. spinosa]|uniref:C2 domain-containing protein n=1 Tax=Ziziphus jujuba var. spinosa TaxID=714518 RepID=A0A978V3R3_ZIZJJ|nr:hypothetical protein FEM48_Zijuj07G0091000 [Ziziphus jujuba var. spinosa]